MKFSKVLFLLGFTLGICALILPRIGQAWMYANTMADVMWWSAVAAISLIVLSFIVRLFEGEAMIRLSAGTRVRVPARAGWRQDFTGTITDRQPRPVTTTSGQDLFYQVQFDEGQYDADDDGPYIDGEVLASYLEPIGKPS